MKLPITVVLLSCCPKNVVAQSVDTTHQVMIKAFVGAFNDHDVPRMVSYVHEDVQWFSVVDDSLVVEVKGKKQLDEWLVGYFKSIPSARSELEAIMPSGSYIAVRERAFWIGKKGERSQVSVCVYEIRDEKIRRVWYFPAEQLDRR